MKKIKQVEIKVNEILLDNPETRDDDNLLICEYLKSLDYGDFIAIANEIYNKKIVTIFKSVERSRRKLQEKNPALRGEVWLKRHLKQEEFIAYSREKNGL